MNLSNLDPFKLQPNPWNSNRVDRKAFEKLKESLLRYGAFKPIVVREVSDGTLQIVGGYHRNEAAKELGWALVPVINLGELSDDRAKEIGLIDNTRYGEDDKELLDKILDELTDLDALEAVLPEDKEVELDLDDEILTSMAEEEIEALREEREDDGSKVIKIKLPTEKAEEIERILKRVADDHDYKYRDGYTNYGDALYHVLILERE